MFRMTLSEVSWMETISVTCSTPSTIANPVVALGRPVWVVSFQKLASQAMFCQFAPPSLERWRTTVTLVGRRPYLLLPSIQFLRT